MDGPTRFARYAYAPNRLGYCGPDAAEELLGEAGRHGDRRALRLLAQQFEGAFPYLELIARANGIADPLDERVVDAYWLGNNLLNMVRPRDLSESLGARFGKRVAPAEMRWLERKPADGAVPMHAFHVLDVLPRMGLLRGGKVDDVLAAVDACRIRWGRVIEPRERALVVESAPLALVDGRLTLAAPRREVIETGANVKPDDVITAGDTVAIHWGWACERLDPARLARLRQWTVRQLAIANQTI